MSGERWLCLQCSTAFDVEPTDDLAGCPGCGDSRGTPANLTTDTVTVDITWHELRVLTIWAEMWAGKMPDEDDRLRTQRVVAGIADRIHAQHLDERPLTLTGELAQLRSDFGQANVEVAGFNEIPPEDPQ